MPAVARSEQGALARAGFETLFRQWPGAVILAEAPSGRILTVNDGVECIWRRKLVDIRNIDDYCRYCRTFREDGREYQTRELPLARSIASGEIVKDEECMVLRGDGTRGVMSVSSAPIRDSGGKIVAAVAVFRDITERKREEALHNGESRMLAMIAAGTPLREVLTGIIKFIECQADGMLCSILLLDHDGLHVRHGAAPSLPELYIHAINGAPIGPRAGSCGTAMYRGKPVIVTDILEDPLWEDYRALAQSFQLRACWSTPIMSHKGNVLGSFAMYYHEPRSPTAQETRLTKVATHVAGIAIERQQAEEALRRSEERYRRIVDTAYEGIWVIDETSTITFVNGRMAEMLGYSVAEIVGRSMRDFLHGESTGRIEERGRRKTDQFDSCFRRKDGSEVWAILSTTPVLDGGVGSVLGMVTDITARKLGEEELRRSSCQIRDLAGRLITAQEEERRRISRELHDDLVQTVASLAISISRIKQKLPDSAIPLAPDLTSLQQRVSGLADDIRQLSHQLHPAVLEHAGLSMALKSFAAEFTRLEGVDVVLTVPATNCPIPTEVALCAYRLVQESLRNVAKHSGAKVANVLVAISDDELHLTVEDKGKGFDIGCARGGLGMVSLQERVRLCNGTLQITSEANCGTTVKARIPLCPP
jgi:PAS domain S-box-containing protein